MGFKAKPKAPDAPSVSTTKTDAPDAATANTWDGAIPGAKKAVPPNFKNPDFNARVDLFKKYDFDSPEFKSKPLAEQKEILEFNIAGKKNPTDGELKKGFHKLARTTHPDKGGDPVAFKNMESSYKRLIDNPDSFKSPTPTYPEYDIGWTSKTSTPPSSPPRLQSGLPGSFGSTSGYKPPQGFSSRFSEYVPNTFKKHPKTSLAAAGALGVGGLVVVGSDSTPAADGGTTGGGSRFASSEPTYSPSEFPPSGQVVY